MILRLSILETPRSEAEYNFSRLLRLLTVLQRGDERQKNGVVSLLLCILKKLLYGLA